MDGEFQLKDIIGIIKRRYLFFVIPFVLLASAAAGVAVLLPPVYQSSGLILIESPQISQAIVAGSIDSAARERIEVIKQRVMTRTNLLAISEKFGVFRGQDNEKLTSSEIVTRMRELASVEFISSGASRRTQVTIAFKVSFDNRNPQVAARVANELVTLFMNENIKTRTQIATETTEFLKQEAEKLERQLVEIEDKIANYKQKHSDALPENLNLQIEVRERVQRQIQEVQREIGGYEEELRFLDVQLRAAQVDASAIINQQRQQQLQQQQSQQTQQKVSSAELQFPELDEYHRIRTDLATALATKAEKHPDVRALKRELEGEKARLNTLGGLVPQLVQIADIEYELRALNSEDTEKALEERAALTAKRDDLRALVDAELQSQVPEPQVTQTVPVVTTDPLREFSIENIRTKMSVSENRIESLRQQKEQLERRLAEVEESIILTPQVDRSLRGLERDYANAQRKYNEIRDKAMEAQIAENVEEASKSERFVLVEPPTVPDQPQKPDRLKLLAMGLAASIAVGAASLVGIEFIDGSVRSAESLANLIEMVPLAVIPYIETSAEKKKRRMLRIWLGVSVVLLGLAALVAIHFFYMPLDRLTYKLLDRF